MQLCFDKQLSGGWSLFRPPEPDVVIRLHGSHHIGLARVVKGFLEMVFVPDYIPEMYKMDSAPSAELPDSRRDIYIFARAAHGCKTALAKSNAVARAGI